MKTIRKSKHKGRSVIFKSSRIDLYIALNEITFGTSDHQTLIVIGHCLILMKMSKISCMLVQFQSKGLHNIS